MEHSARYTALKEKVKKNGVSQRSSQYAQLKQKVRSSGLRSDVDEQYINTFLKDSQSFVTQAQSDYAGISYKTATDADAYAKREAASGELNTRSGKIRAYLNANKGKLDQESYKSLISYLDDFSGAQTDIYNGFQKQKAFYSRWDTEEAYNSAVELGMADAERWAELTGGYDPTKHQAEGKAGWDDYVATQERLAQKTKESESTEKPWWEKALGYLGDIGPDTSLPFHADTNEISQGYQAQDARLKKPDDRWSDEQRETFGYLWKTDRQKSYEYAFAVNNMLNTKAENAKIERIQSAAIDNFWAGVGHTMGALAAAPLGLGDYLGDLMAYGSVGYIPQADGEVSPFEYSQAVTGGISQHLNEVGGTLNEDIPIIGGKGWGDVYGLSTSIAQSALAAYTSGGTGALVQYFGSAGAAGVDDALNRGATPEQALAIGTISGAAEALAEKMGIDNLLKIGSSHTLKQLLSNILKQGAAEGLEEGATSLINLAADNFIMQDKSSFHAAVQKYMDAGLSEEEAKNKAWGEMWSNVAYDVLGGFASGVVHAGPKTAYHTFAQNRYAKNTYGGSQKELVDEALEIDPGNAFAQKMQGRLDSGKNLSGAQLNQLVQQNEAALTAQDMSKIQSAIEARLIELGETGDVTSLAAALTKQAQNQVDYRKIKNEMKRLMAKGYSLAEALEMAAPDVQNLSHAEENLIANSQYGQRVANELNTENIRSGQYASAWAENIDTQRINAQEYSRLMEAAQLEQEGAEQSPSQEPEVFDSPLYTRGPLEGAQEQSAENPPVTADAATAPFRQGGLGAEGKTTLQEDGQEVAIREIAKVSDGKLTLRLEDGRTVDADAIAYGSEGEALLYEAVATLDADAEVSNLLVNTYRDHAEGVDVGDYALGVVEAFRYGTYNIPKAELESNSFTAKLTALQRNTAYALGQRYGGKQVATAEAKARRARFARNYQKAAQSKTATTEKSSAAGSGKVQFMDGSKRSDLREHVKQSGKQLSPQQETAVATMEKLSAILGVNFYVYESYVKDGKRLYVDENGTEKPAPNGRYTNGRDIYIDLNAGTGGKGAMLYTVAHELTHFIRQWSPAKFKKLANFLMKQYGERGVSIEELIHRKIKNAERYGLTYSFDAAFEEVVADSMETMLNDGSVVFVMAELKQQDKTLWQKICDWFKDLVADLKAVTDAYSGIKPDSPEGRMVAEMDGVITMLEGLYTEALLEASENAKAAGAEKNTAQEGDVKYSLRAFEKDGRRFVEIDQEQDRFDGHSDDEYPGIAKEIIKEKFENKVVGIDNKMFVNGAGRSEYAYPSKPITDASIYEAKMRASPELDNLLDAGTNFRNEADGRDGHIHPDVIGGFDYFDTLFKIGNRYFEGRINIKNVKRGKLFTDVTQIKDVTQAIMSSYGNNPKSQFLRTSSINSIRNPEADVKEKLSLRDPEVEKAAEAVRRENEKLREDVARLRELLKLQRQVTGGTKFTKSSVEAAARYLKQTAVSKGDTAELAKLLNGFYEQIAQSKELTWEDVQEQALPAARWLMEHKVMESGRTEYAEDILKELRSSRISLDESQKGEAAYRWGSFNDFRKAAMGTVTVSKDGVPLDEKWQDWAAMYPGVFDTNISSTDMPGALMDTVASLRSADLSRVEAAYQEELIEQDLLRQVYDSYWRVSTLRTVADRMQKQINALKSVHYTKMDELRSTHREKVESLRKEHRERLQQMKAERRQALEQQQKEASARYQESRKRAAEGRERTAMRHKIRNVVNELNQHLLKGTKERHVPIELQKAVAEALDAVNMDTVGAEERIARLEQDLLKAKTPEQIQEISRKIDNVRQMGGRMHERLTKLRDAYEQFVNSDDPLIANSHDEVISNKLQAVIEAVGNTPLRDMTLSQLGEVYDMYRMVLTTIRNANKAFKAKKNESIAEIAGRVMTEVKEAGGKKKQGLAMLNGIKDFGWNNLKPVYAFEHIGSDAFTEVFNNVRAGEDVWAVDVTEAREFYLGKSRKYGYDGWDFRKQHSFTSTSGIEFSLGLEQIMSLYAYSKRDQAAEHLKRGGIVIDETTEVTVKTKLGIPVKFNPTEATAYNISDETLAEIIGKLTDEQKAFVDEMQEYLSTVMGGKGNEVSLAMYGIKLFKEKFYFPLKSATQFMAKAKEQQQGEAKIKNKGFSKETVRKASNPIVLTPFMNVWAEHVNEMSMYHAFVLPMEDFYRVYNFKTATSETAATESVEMYIQNAYGKGATRYIDQLLKDLNGGARTDHTTGFINKAMGLFKKGAVFASLSVVIQQPSAIARAAALVDTKYFIGPKVDHQRHKALWNEVKQYAPVAIIKEMGYFDTNMGKSTQDFITAREYSGFTERMTALITDSGYRDEVLSKAPALADEIAWCGIWEAVKRETRAKHPDMDVRSEEFLQLVGKRFTEVIVKTQVYDSVLSRSGLMRSKDTGMKTVTAFMAEPTTSINMIADALLQGKRGNRKYCRAAIGAVIASQILNSILVSFVYAMRDDDEDESYAEKYIGALTGELLDSLNPAGYIPFIKDIMSIVQGYDVERSDMAVISDLWNGIQSLGKENVPVYRKVENFAGSIGQIFGLPAKNIMRDARAMYQTVMSFVDGEPTTAAGIGYAVQGAVTGKTVPNTKQLYDAYVSGDSKQIDRVVSRFKDQAAVTSAIRKALREQDPRIREAAEAKASGDMNGYLQIAREIIAEKHFSQDNVVAAINAEVNAMTKEESTSSGSQKAIGLFKAEDFALAIAQGDAAMAQTVRNDIIQTARKNGKTTEEAEKGFISAATSACKDMFDAGELTEDQTEDALVNFCGKTEGEAFSKVQYWAFKQEHPDVYVDDTWIDEYYEEVADSGMEIDAFVDYRNRVKGITGEDKKERRMAVIHSLPISRKQKDALYYAEGWAESKIGEAPWH